MDTRWELLELKTTNAQDVGNLQVPLKIQYAARAVKYFKRL